MIGCPHEVPRCAACNDTGFVDDPLSAVECGDMPDLLPCPRGCGAEEGHMVRGLDQWKLTLPVDERELDAERRAAVEEEIGGIERCLAHARQLGELPWALELEEGDDLSW